MKHLYNYNHLKTAHGILCDRWDNLHPLLVNRSLESLVNHEQDNNNEVKTSIKDVKKNLITIEFLLIKTDNLLKNEENFSANLEEIGHNILLIGDMISNLSSDAILEPLIQSGSSMNKF